MLAKLLSPDTASLLYALAGAAFAWWLKRNPDPLKPADKAVLDGLKARPAVLQVLDLLFARHDAQAHADAHDTLQALAQPVASVVTAAPAPAAK